MTTTPAADEAPATGADDRGHGSVDTLEARDEQGGAIAGAPEEPIANLRGWPAVLDYLLWCLVPLAIVLMTTGFFPGSSPSQLSWMLGAGQIECLNNMGLSAFSSYCNQIGAPVGSPLLSGLPQTYLGALLNHLPLIDAWRAYMIVAVLTIVGSYAAGVAVLKRFGAPTWLASLGTFVYLTSSTVLMLNGYIYTFHGFVMVPAATWAVFTSLRLFRQGRRVPALLIAFVTAWLMVFTDGYAFITSTVLVLAIGIAWLVGDTPLRNKLWGGIGWAVAVGSGALAYLSYIPAGSTHPHTGLGSFRFYGADVISFLVPSPTNYWAADMPWKGVLGRLWGTSDNQFGNYFGYISLGLVVTLIVLGALRRGSARRGELIALLVVGVVCAILSLGPNLKFGNVATGRLSQDNLPADLTRFALPTSFLYENVPGFQDMRATYRSFVITRWVLVVLAVVALVMLLRTRAKVLVPFLALLLLLDSMPDFAKQIANREFSRVQLDSTRTNFAVNLALMIKPGDKALILPSSNDFLASAFVPFTGGTSYNVGIDKNLEYSRDNWPASVTATAKSYGSPKFGDDACALLHSDATVIVLSYQGLLTGAVDSATIPTAEPALVTRAQDVAHLDRFAITETTSGIALRIRPDQDCTGS